MKNIFEKLGLILSVINDMKREGIIGEYAIGGSIGAMFYIEPFYTKDVDIFTHYKQGPDGLIDPAPVYRYLRLRGYKMQGWRALMEDVLVDFIPAGTELVEEAIENALEDKYNDVPCRVISPEYLIAMSVECGRRMDWARIEKFFNQQIPIQVKRLKEVLVRHGLWKKFKAEFPDF